jgi:phosphoesterase RecJ-like protein
MTVTAPQINNRGEENYAAKITQIADKLKGWDGSIVIISHQDPDGDALGSTLALKRGLETFGKEVTLPFEPPPYLKFLAKPGELSKPLDKLPENCLLAVIDVEIGERATGAPLTGAAFTVNVDHHGTNPRTGDLSCVEPSRAASAHLIKDILDAAGVSWTPEIATPCLTGMLTDTGNFRFVNTTPDLLRAAADLLATGLDYAELNERLQERKPDYYRMLGKVMATACFPLGGLVAMAHMSEQMRAEIGESEDDSDDFVGVIRYAEGAVVAIFLREKGAQETKISVRTRQGVSAQAICVALGGGGHLAAAGATVQASLAETRRRVLVAAKDELERHGFEVEA